MQKNSSAKQKLAVVINFCSSDIRFFDKCVSEAKKFSDQIIIPVCDHFFDGKPENLDLLHHVYCSYPDCQFIQYPYSHESLYSYWIHRHPQDDSWKMFWYTTSRYIGFLYLDPEIDYVLFLDTDEIIESRRFIEWIDTCEYQKYDALRLLSYFYFREAFYQAETFVPNALMAKKKVLSHHVLFNDRDRFGAFSKIGGRKFFEVVGKDQKPLVHHYSWVRTKEEALRKGETSAHDKELDFKNLIEKEYSSEFEGKDFILSYSYQKVEPFFDPLAVLAPKKLLKSAAPLKNVLYVDRGKVFQKEIENLEFPLGINFPFREND